MTHDPFTKYCPAGQFVAQSVMQSHAPTINNVITINQHYVQLRSTVGDWAGGVGAIVVGGVFGTFIMISAIKMT